MMKYEVWSCGSKNAYIVKLGMFLSFIGFCLCCHTHIGAFFVNLNDKNLPMTLGEHLFLGIFCMFFLGIVTFSMFCLFKKFKKELKRNKKINLFLFDAYDFDNFCDNTNDKCILFKDENGVVLGEIGHQIESEFFIFGCKSFREIKNHCESCCVNT